jgi:SAM-dependent methyltransferase
MTTIDTALDVQIKSAHRRMWASGDYPAVASEVIPELGKVLIQALGVQPNDKVLDVAAGSGNAAIPAARAGAHVTATDLASELFDAGRRDAAVAGVNVSWLEADAERLPFGDGSFDVAMSSVGVMFTPFHQRSADELVRVVRPGGRIGLINWTPGGFIGEVFATMKPYAAPPPAGAQPPPLWGDPDHLARLFGDKVTGVRTERRMLTVDRFHAPEDFLAFFKKTYGPTIAVYARLANDPTASAELDQTLTELARDNFGGQPFMQWEYLLATATVV